jgi:hypothetical protein
MHSPVDRYRCENEDCEAEAVWEFRPDDYELDESVVNCPACGQEGELFFRVFRGGAGSPAGYPMAEPPGVVLSKTLAAIVFNAESWHHDDEAKGRALAVIARWGRDALAGRLHEDVALVSEGDACRALLDRKDSAC